MYKIITYNTGISKRYIYKLLFAMRLITILLLATIMQVSANTLAQNITFRQENVTLEVVFKEIKKQTGYNVFWYAEKLKDAKPVNVDFRNEPLKKVLDQLLADQPFTYTIDHKTVVIKSSGKLWLDRMLDSVHDLLVNIEIKGRVIGEDGAPLIGASVKVKGSNKATITDSNGEFILMNVEENAVLEISFLGHTPITVEGRKNLGNIVLRETTSALDQVVVVGYGKQKKVSVTGAVSSIDGNSLMKGSSATLAASLAGRLPGLTSIQAGGGQPGWDDATMYLRGAATTNGKSPLILIDGVPRDNIRTIDANEVASVSILKDASATAVFGVRGANGVILITTKRGEVGKAELTVNAEQSYASFSREPERLHSLEYMKLRNEALINDNEPIQFNQQIMDKYANPLLGLDPNDSDYANKAAIRNYIYPDHDYYREFISRYAPQFRVNTNARGGTDKVSYFVNAGYLHQGGNLNTEPKSVLGYDPSVKMDRFNFRANLDYKITNSLKSFLNLGSYIEKVNNPSPLIYSGSIKGMMNDLFYQAQTILPITPGPVTIAGFGVAPGQIVDPAYIDRSAFEIMNRTGYWNEVRSDLNSTFGLELDLRKAVTQGLSIKGMISYDAKSNSAIVGTQAQRLYLANVDPQTDQLSYAISRMDENLLFLAKQPGYSRYNINAQGSVNYNRKFGKHDVGGMLLAQRDYWESAVADIPFNVVGVAARFTYDYDSRYLAEINMGYNGSEQFAPIARYGFFPAVSVGWVVSNEAFLKDNAVITNLKIRGSYGKVGNDQIGGVRFLYISDIKMGGGPLGSLSSGKGVNQGLLANPNVKWEMAKKQNIGIDLQVVKDLSLTFDYFTENRSDILIQRQTVPELQGMPLNFIPKVNMGIVDNKGYELELTYNKNLSKNFSLMVKGNYNYNHNIVKFIDEQIRDETYASRYVSTGYPLGQSFGLKIDYSNGGNGYFNSAKDLADYLSHTTYSFGAPRVGDFKYVDINGDGIVSEKDQVPIGTSVLPRVSYGLMLNLRFKSFELTAFFQGVSKYSSNYAEQGVYEFIKRGTYFDYHKNAWTPERYANGSKITYPALSTFKNTNHTANDFFIMDRSYLRLRNIELAYNLPSSALKVFGVQALRVYASAQNLFTWDHLRMGHLDPENDSALGYPVIKMMNLGIHLTF